MDGLDEFEKTLAADKAQRDRDEERRERKHRHHSHRSHRDDKDDRRHRRHRDDSRERDRDGHRRHRRDDNDKDDEDGERRRHKRSRREGDDSEGRRRDKHRKTGDAKRDLPLPDEEEPASKNEVDATKAAPLQRDSWMMAPSALDMEYIHRPAVKEAPKSPPKPERVISKREINTHLHALDEGASLEQMEPEPVAERKFDYTFGDAGSSWRMAKLKAVYTAAEESGTPVEELAMQRFGSLEYFDDAREEKEEVERRRVYGKGYEIKEKPSGELYQERLRQQRKGESPIEEREPEQGTVIPEEAPVVDQTTLNRMRAQMMKAKLRKAPNAAQLEQEYNRAAAASQSNSSVVIGAMESRQLAGTRAEVKNVDTKRGRERGKVEENTDMTIDDMVREERRTKGQAGGEALRQAERIAKDGKFETDLDYMDDNAAKLAKRMHKGEASLKNAAVAEYQKLNRILDSCPLCHHEDTNRPPVAPVVSLATRTFLTLPPEPEISSGGAMIVPLSHKKNLLECDDDEWEELRNFMKSLTRMYHAQGQDVLFYENAARPHRHQHAAMVAAPIPYEEGAMAPAHFREAFLSSDAQWSQHKPVIDTLAASKTQGRAAFRRSIAKEMPYFHVWFTLDGGMGHVVEDDGAWPKGDLFAREVIGGIAGAEVDVIKKQGRWVRGKELERVDGFRSGWRKYDWTRMLEA